MLILHELKIMKILAVSRLNYIFPFLILYCMSISVSTCDGDKTIKVLYQDNFNSGLDNWIIEQMENGEVKIVDGKMDISQGNGAVVWFKNELKAPITITYDAEVVYKNGVNDRVADLNCFWMASDPNSPNKFFKNSKERSGVFNTYFSHKLYYVGQGAHNNTKTRFRKYLGNGERPLNPNHDLTEKIYMITPNKKNKIKIISNKNYTQYYCNGLLIFNISQDSIYTSGYFGIRSFKNHIIIDNFKVTKP